MESLRLDGTTFPQALSITALPQGGMGVMVRDISDRTRAEEQLGVLSTRDDLTGLLNRRGFRETVRPLIAGAQRVASG